MRHLNINKSMFLLLLSMAGSSTFAATTPGTQTFTANITDSTCVITGQNISHDFGEVTKQDLLAKGDWVPVKSYDDVMSVTGCPDTLKEVKVAFSYDALDPMGAYGWMENKGTAKGLGLKLIRDRTNGGSFNEGANGYTFPLTNGGVDIPIGIDLARVAKSLVPDADVASGTAEFDAALVFTMK